MLILIEGRKSDTKCIREEREREGIGESLEDEGRSCAWHQNQRHLGGGGVRSWGSADLSLSLVSPGCHRPCGVRLGCACFQ